MRLLPSTFALLLAIFGGIYFGFFSCGGYVWHKQAFFVVLGLATLVAFVIPFKQPFPLIARGGMVVATVGSFIMSEAIAAPFYPAPPESLFAYLKAFVRALEYGPC